MRINQYLAQATGMSRRSADTAIEDGRVQINGQPAALGSVVEGGDRVTLDKEQVNLPTSYTYLKLNKPVGYVTSRVQQGNAPTIYDVLPAQYRELKPVGRLDKDSSGLLLLTNDGELANQLTHPSQEKIKRYEVELDKPLSEADKERIQTGVKLDDGSSSLHLQGKGKVWTVRMSEGRNRQIRRTFEALGYTVTKLHRTRFGDLELGDLTTGQYAEVSGDQLQ